MARAQTTPAWRSLHLRPGAGDGPAAVLDLDSTLWDLFAALAPLVRDELGLWHLSQAQLAQTMLGSWNGIYELAGERTAELFERAFTYEAMRRVGPFDGAAEAVGRLRSAGVRIVVMTHRPPWCLEDVAAFLADHGIGADEIHCGHMDKVAECQAAGIRVLVDDKPDTIAAAHAAGLAALSLAYPYNAPLLARLGLPAPRSWAELEPHVARALGL